jgi:hypothetical protein
MVCVILAKESPKRRITMEELAKQVKSEMLRTVLWIAISLGVGVGVYYLAF